MKHINGMMDLVKKKLEYVVCFGVVVLVVIFSIIPQVSTLELGFYNLLLGIKPEITERSDVLLLNIDDLAIEEIGTWPWSRDVLADVLIRFREAGGRKVVFDIEYLSPGQTGVNTAYVRNKFPEEYESVQNEILDYLSQFSAAIANRNIPYSDALEVGSEMASYIEMRMADLATSISSNIFRDNDEYFAQAIRFFGATYLTINTAQINTRAEAIQASQWAWENMLLRTVEDPAGQIASDNAFTRAEKKIEKGISPAVLPLLRVARGAGFPNSIIDRDGVRRRIELLTEYNGRYVGQLVFVPILDILQPEKIIRRGSRLILVQALDPQALDAGIERRRDISIPLDRHGRLLVNWLKQPFVDPVNPENGSFRNISVYALKVLDKIEEILVGNLITIKNLGIRTATGYLSYRDAAVWLHDQYRDLERWKHGLMEGSREDFDEYFTARTEFFNMYGEFLDGGFDTEIYEAIARIREITGDESYDELLDRLRSNFDSYRQVHRSYMGHLAELRAACEGSFAVIGYSGVGTTDLGVNPFWRAYPNVGKHANIYNTIMTGEYITPAAIWISWLVALAFCYAVALINRKLKSLSLRILYGIGATVVVFGLGVFLMSVFRIYLEMLVPLVSVFKTFILISILRFIFSEQEKSFIRKAFTMYLSSEVVNEIVENPNLLRLGGQEKNITALFTDIKSFSTLSEKVTPEHLVEILNKYLTVMSDIVLDQKGTIDKYIGDAIVSFFGAPLDLPDHATRACYAAIRMKQAEDKLNEELMATGDIPMPLYTRIGINTGAMVVGNMGTDNKMNYTIMGNDVNMAARLEGVNKQYGTWILVAESTWNETKGLFVGRRLDRVRVLGIDKPVQLYNILGVRAEADNELLSMVDNFHVARDLYLNRQFKDAAEGFASVLKSNPSDYATKIFMERCRELAKTGVPDNWTDVISMVTK